jgi:hypothetical protein
LSIFVDFAVCVRVKQRAELRLCTLWSVFQVGSRSYVSQDHHRFASRTGHVEFITFYHFRRLNQGSLELSRKSKEIDLKELFFMLPA